MTNGFNPLAGLTDGDLFNSQLTLNLACGRAKAVLKGRHRELLCALSVALKLEADHRGRPSPTPPYVA